jgi:hypothetical protein
MSSENKPIDDFFKEKLDSLGTDGISSKTSWEEMQANLQQPGPGPKKILRKKITRRWITYMGLAALVTTVTWFAVNDKSSQSRVSKTRVSKTQVSLKPITPVVSIPLPAKTATYRPKPLPTATKPTAKYQPRPVSVKKLFSVSDTVFQKPMQTPTPAASQPNLASFFDRMKDPEQQFEIAVDRDTLLFGKEGTVLFVPRNSFVSPKGKVSGNISLQLAECYTYPQMMAYGLATVSDGLPLVTGGMLRIEAMQNEQPLLLANGRSLKVSMPMSEYDPEMQLFLSKPRLDVEYREKMLPNPQLVVDNQENSIRMVQGDSIRIGDPLLVVNDGSNWRPAGQSQAFKNYERYVTQKKIKLFNIQQKVKGINANDQAEFLVDAPDYISDDKIKQLLLSRYSSAGIKKISINRQPLSGAYKAKKTMVAITSEGFVGVDSLMLTFENAIKDKLVSRDDSLAFRAQNRLDSIRFFEKLRADSIAFVKTMEFNKAYNFDISTLGWINCDKFGRSTAPMVEFSLPIDPAAVGGLAKYHLVFINSKTILSGRYEPGLVNFGKIPVGEPVHVVCVAEKDGVTVGCIEKTVTGPSAMASLKFAPVSPEEFKKRVSQL